MRDESPRPWQSDRGLVDRFARQLTDRDSKRFVFVAPLPPERARLAIHESLLAIAIIAQAEDDAARLGRGLRVKLGSYCEKRENSLQDLALWLFPDDPDEWWSLPWICAHLESTLGVEMDARAMATRLWALAQGRAARTDDRAIYRCRA